MPSASKVWEDLVQWFGRRRHALKSGLKRYNVFGVRSSSDIQKNNTETLEDDLYVKQSN